jgi:hypothetical protein
VGATGAGGRREFELIASPDWYAAKEGESCSDVCTRQQLVCSETEFARRNRYIDADEKVLHLIAVLGENTTAETCRAGISLSTFRVFSLGLLTISCACICCRL